jgi:hypothetical protein
MALPFYTAWKTVSSTPSDYWKDSFQALVDSEFENSPTIKTVLHNGTSIVVRVVGKFNKETLSRKNDDYQKIIFKDYDYVVSVGDLFVFDNSTWLCTDVGSTVVSKSCTVQKCNNVLEFYSTVDSSLYSIPIIITNKIIIDDEENKYLTTIDNTIYMMCNSTLITQQIKPDNVFKIGIYNYKILSVPDDISILNILTFKLEYSEVEATTHAFTIEILNGSTIDLQESTNLQLNVNYYDNGVLVSPTPTLTFTSNDETICTVNSTGLVTALDVIDNCVISVSANGVSDSIVVSVIEAEQHNYTYTLSSTSSPDGEIKVNQTKTYVASKYDNGIGVTQTFTFSLSGEASAYTFTVIDGNNCSLKCLKSGYVVVLSAVDNSDSSKVVTKTISLKSLF